MFLASPWLEIFKQVIFEPKSGPKAAYSQLYFHHFTALFIQNVRKPYESNIFIAFSLHVGPNLVNALPQFLRRFQPPPFLRHPPLAPSLLKTLFPLLSFLFHPLLRYFRQFSHPHATPSCPNPTNQPLVWTNIRRVISPLQLLLSIKNQFLIF